MSLENKDPKALVSEGQQEVVNQLEIISTDGQISLRQYSLENAEEIFALIDRNREHLSQFGEDTPVKYPTLESVRESILHPHNEKRLRFGIINKADVLVGTINLTPDNNDPRKGEIGYYLGAEFQGQGYVNKAIGALTDYAFQNLGYKNLFGSVHPDNMRSIRALRGNGYLVTARNRQGRIILTKGKTP
jgi:ribosomal-protein-serine acetyltransferase